MATPRSEGIFFAWPTFRLAGLFPDAATIRAAAIAVWHIAKAALVRDFAERVLQGEVPVNESTPDTLSHWLAARLLTPEQLADFEDQSARADDAS